MRGQSKGSKYGSSGKQPPKREQRRDSREDQKQVEKDRADKYAETRKRLAEKRAIEDAIDPELMAMTYGPNWKAVVEKELFPATPQVPTVRETEAADADDSFEDDYDQDVRDARADLGLDRRDDEAA